MFTELNETNGGPGENGTYGRDWEGQGGQLDLANGIILALVSNQGCCVHLRSIRTAQACLAEGMRNS